MTACDTRLLGLYTFARQFDDMFQDPTVFVKLEDEYTTKVFCFVHIARYLSVVLASAGDEVSDSIDRIFCTNAHAAI